MKVILLVLWLGLWMGLVGCTTVAGPCEGRAVPVNGSAVSESAVRERRP
jgi:hypothetical protein